MLRALLVVVLVAGCGAGAAATKPTVAPPRCGGDVVLTTMAELAAVGRCRVYTGSVTIRGVDILSLSPLVKLERITGDLNITTAFELDAVSGMDGLREVGGTFKISGNPIATGA